MLLSLPPNLQKLICKLHLLSSDICSIARSGAVSEESNLALRSVTEGAGPHSDEVWRAAAVCAVEHFVQQEVFFLGLYGYKVLTNKMWSPLSMGSLKPTLGINVCQHIEQAGHTWYILECEIMAITDPPVPCANYSHYMIVQYMIIMYFFFYVLTVLPHFMVNCGS